MASLPPSLDAAKDREKWRKVTPPERKKTSPEHSQTLEETTPSHPAQGEPLPSSENTSHPSIDPDKDATENEESVQDPQRDALQQTPSRRGIWEWARAGTGRLNIIGRIPHPEWRGPAFSRNPGTTLNGVHDQTIHEAHDDFSIPSTTATEPDNADRQREAASANAEGLGIAATLFMSPSFAQTKRSSDELVAAASSTGSPDTRAHDEPWTNGEASTPSAASKESPPSTPDTPTPQQKRKNLTHNNNATVDEISPTNNGELHQPKDNSSKNALESASYEPTPTKKKPVSTETPKSNTSAKTSKGPRTSSPHHIPKYKIALAPNLLSPARTGTAST